MKIAFYGNVANNAYQIVHALQSYTNIDAHLYLDTREKSAFLPENDNPSLKDTYPEWIHEIALNPLTTLLTPWCSPLVAELNQYDFVMVSGIGPVFAQFLKNKWCFMSTGGDLTLTPFPFKFLFYYRGLKSKLFHLILGQWQRMGLRHAPKIWSQPFFPFANAIKNLSIPPERVSWPYFLGIVDTERFVSNPDAAKNTDENMGALQEHDFVVFHPSRIMLDTHPRRIATGDWKGNDKLIEGFAQFAARCPGNPVLAMPDRVESSGVEEAKEMIARLGIEKNIVWLKPPRSFGFTRDELISFYSVADVVADEFATGWYGAVVLEGMSFGKPVLCTVDHTIMDQLYPWHPILSPQTPEEIANELEKLYRHPEIRQKIGQQGREWVVMFHSAQNAGPIYVERLTELFADLNLEVPED
jgi:glycosyltransferase involved in cell wall biosynthesis